MQELLVRSLLNLKAPLQFYLGLEYRVQLQPRFSVQAQSLEPESLDLMSLQLAQMKFSEWKCSIMQVVLCVAMPTAFLTLVAYSGLWKLLYCNGYLRVS